MTSDWACTGTNNVIKSSTVIPTQLVGLKYQLTMEDDLNAKLTALSRKVEALALAEATTSISKETSTMCVLCDTTDHCTDVCPIMAGVKEARGQVNAINQFLRSENNPYSNTYNPS